MTSIAHFFNVMIKNDNINTKSLALYLMDIVLRIIYELDNILTCYFRMSYLLMARKN